MPEIDIALKFLARALYKLRGSPLGNGLTAPLVSYTVLLQQTNHILRERCAEANRNAALQQHPEI